MVAEIATEPQVWLWNDVTDTPYRHNAPAVKSHSTYPDSDVSRSPRVGKVAACARRAHSNGLRLTTPDSGHRSKVHGHGDSHRHGSRSRVKRSVTSKEYRS